MQVTDQEKLEAERVAQERQEFQEGLQRMVADVKKKLKNESKNELLRIVSALLVDNFMLKTQLEALVAERQSPEQAKEGTENA